MIYWKTTYPVASPAGQLLKDHVELENEDSRRVGAGTASYFPFTIEEIILMLMKITLEYCAV